MDGFASGSFCSLAEQDTSMSQEVHAGVLTLCEKRLVLPVEFVHHHGDF